MASRTTFFSTLCITSLLLACSADHGGTSKVTHGTAHADDDDAGTASDGTVQPGDQVDTNGDGKPDQPLPGDTGTGGGDGDQGTFTPADAGTSPFPTNGQGQVLCGDVPCACSDGEDNDKDGLTDLADPECVSAWDDDESSFATGIPGDNRDDACQDCFFDGNSGSGDDGCRLPSSCLSEGNASSGHGNCNTCEQSDQCRNFCKAFTPNGCDCFGCCTVRLANGTSKSVLVADGCNIDGSTLAGCTACVPNDSCGNTCGKCELCPGKTAADLPAECFSNTGSDAGTGGGTPGATCDDGEARCGSGLPACPSGQSCTFGCCVLIPTVL